MLFITFGKIAFVLSFMAIMMPLAAKYKAIGNFIAKNRLMQLIGNVSFGGYLYHFTVIMLRLNSQSTMPSYKFYDLFGAWFSDIIYTLILATASTLLIELPVQNMWRVGLEGKLMNKLKAYVDGSKKGRGSSGSNTKRDSKSQNLPKAEKPAVDQEEKS